MSDFKEILKERLAMTFNGETQYVTAERLNTSQSNISKWISGQQIPTTDTLFLISKTYKVSVDWLLGLSDEPEVDGLAIDKLTYEQVAKIFDWLIQNNTIEIPNLVDAANEKELYFTDEEESIDPIYDSDYIKIKDRLLAYIMRRRQLLTNPELNMLDVWCNRLIPFHEVRTVKYSNSLEKAIDAHSPSQFSEGDWAELIQKLSKLSKDELEEIVNQIKEKKGEKSNG